MSDLELCYTPAVELARRMRAGDVSPVEVVSNALERIDEVNPVLNCFCFTYPEEALARAKAIEGDLAAGRAVGPLAGVPIAIKDFTPTKGKVTTRGSVLLKDWVPDHDAVLVERLLAAGAIMVGKTTTPEFAYSSFTRSPLWGDTGNPWRPSHCAGGSSGGSGAAVASGCVPMAEGTDMGGSVRIPAAFCGTVGLKPSLGRLPMDIVSTVYDNISHFGPLTRTIDDAALFIDIGQGMTPADIQSLPACDLSLPVNGDVRGLKIAIDPDLGFYALNADVERNLWRVADALRDAGAEVHEVDLGWDARLPELWSFTWQVYLAAAYRETFGDTFEAQRHLMDQDLAAIIEVGFKWDAVSARSWEFERTRYWHKLAAVLEDHHALLCPTMAQPVPPNSMSDKDFEEIDENGKLAGLDMTSVFNYFAQCPALSVPSGFADGLPTAAQIVTRKWDDPLALRIGAAVERALPWAGKRPTIA
jgi:Asp-tRNA(Asn)/Glu-tRNA(Gln) amidotransferase A subunit family amidase